MERFVISRARQQSVTQHYQMETENAFIRTTTDIVRRRRGVFLLLQ